MTKEKAELAQLHCRVTPELKKRFQDEADERGLSLRRFVEEHVLPPSGSERVVELLRDRFSPALTRFLLERALEYCDETARGDREGEKRQIAEWRDFRFNPLVQQLQHEPDAEEGTVPREFLQEQGVWLVRNLPAGAKERIREELASLGIVEEGK